MAKPTPIMILVLLMLLAPSALAYGVVFYNPAWNQQDGKVFDVIYGSMVYEFQIKNSEIAVTSLAFKLNKTTYNAGITVYKLNSLPDFLPAVNEGTAYEFNELRYVGFVPFHVIEMTYDFKVSKDWLKNNSASSQNIILHSFNRVLNVWDALPTDIIKEDDSFVFFKSAGKAAHYFFVGLDQSLNKTLKTPVTSLSEATSALEEAEVPSETGNNEEEQPAPIPAVSEEPEQPLEGEEKEIVELSEVTPVILETKSPESVIDLNPQLNTEQPDMQTQPTSENASNNSSGFLIFLVVLAVVVVLILVYVVFGERPLSFSIKKELDNYVKESMKRGKSEDEIRKRLLEVGWHQDRVNRALLRYRRKNINFKSKNKGENN
jgi:PGF-pre-PGF domain-containing protein